MHKLKVFLVEDSISIRISLKKLLSKIEHIDIVGEAESISQANQLLKTIHPDVTILDLNLNDGSGYELLNEIKNGQNPHKVIIFSNYSEVQFKEKAFQNKADYFFDKLTEFEKLIEVIEEIRLKKL